MQLSLANCHRNHFCLTEWQVYHSTCNLGDQLSYSFKPIYKSSFSCQLLAIAGLLLLYNLQYLVWFQSNWSTLQCNSLTSYISDWWNQPELAISCQCAISESLWYDRSRIYCQHCRWKPTRTGTFCSLCDLELLWYDMDALEYMSTNHLTDVATLTWQPSGSVLNEWKMAEFCQASSSYPDTILKSW